jgi:hypothetical protein
MVRLLDTLLTFNIAHSLDIFRHTRLFGNWFWLSSSYFYYCDSFTYKFTATVGIESGIFWIHIDTILSVRTNHLKTGVEINPETSYTSSIPDTMDKAQRDNGTNMLFQFIRYMVSNEKKRWSWTLSCYVFCGRRLWHIWRHTCYSWIRLDRLTKSTITIIHESRYPGRDSNWILH